MQVWYVISTIQIVIDKHFPVTVDVVVLTRKVMEITQSQRSHPLHNSAKKRRQRSRLRIQIHKHKLLPSLYLHRNQPVVLAVKVLHPVELRHPLERPIQPVIPSVIRTMQNRSLPARFRHHRRRVMPAYVIKRAQHAIIPAHRHQWLSRHRRGHELSRLFHLVHSSHHLPSPRENRLPLQFRNPRIHIPRGRNRKRFRQRRRLVVTSNNLLHAHPTFHALFPATCTFSDPIARRNNSTNCSIRASFSSGTGPDLRNNPGSNSSVSSAS